MSEKTRRVALVTGGNRGIGLEIARQLGEKGLDVVITARKDDDGRAAVADLKASGVAADWLRLDVTHADSCKLCLDQMREKHGGVDVLINNAGVALDQWVPVQQLNIDVLRRTMETNLYGALRMCQLVLPGMMSRAYGRIVNLSTELASLSESELGSTAAYRSSKTALNMLTRLLALELKEHPNVLVNAAAPGWVKTELGGPDAPRSPAEGARTPVYLATLPDGGPSGGFFRDEKPYPW